MLYLNLQQASVPTQWTAEEDELLAHWQVRHVIWWLRTFSWRLVVSPWRSSLPQLNFRCIPNKLQSIIGNKWSEISQHIPDKSGQQCAQRWRHRVNPSINRARWTPEEDEHLIELVAQHGNAWAVIARGMVGRTDQQCMGRWKRTLDPAVVKGKWSEEEDAQLVQLVNEMGTAWSEVAAYMKNRNAAQCRVHYMTYHMPQNVSARVRAKGSVYKNNFIVCLLLFFSSTTYFHLFPVLKETNHILYHYNQLLQLGARLTRRNNKPTQTLESNNKPVQKRRNRRNNNDSRKKISRLILIVVSLHENASTQKTTTMKTKTMLCMLKNSSQSHHQVFSKIYR